MLLGLIADLYRDEKLRTRFQSNPEDVAAEYQLSDEEKALLSSGDHGQISDAAKAQVHEVLTALWFATHTTVYMPWIGVTLKVTGIDPSSVAAGNPVSVTVTGTGFQDNATLKFTRPGVTVKATGVNIVTTADGASTMTASANFSTLGLYDVTVSNSANESSTLPQGLDVVATVAAV